MSSNYLKMRILIADDHELLRLGLSIIVKEVLPFAEIIEAKNAHEVQTTVSNKNIDLLLLDVQMPDTDTLALMKWVLAISPALRVLVISVNPESIFALRYIQNGAYGYIEKKEDGTKLKLALNRVALGKKYMSDDLLDIVSEHIRKGKDGQNPFQTLSPREFEIVQLLIKGYSTSEICQAVSLQAPTVSTHKRNILEKLLVCNVFELIELARQYDIR